MRSAMDYYVITWILKLNQISPLINFINFSSYFSYSSSLLFCPISPPFLSLTFANPIYPCPTSVNPIFLLSPCLTSANPISLTSITLSPLARLLACQLSVRSFLSVTQILATFMCYCLYSLDPLHTHLNYVTMVS